MAEAYRKHKRRCTNLELCDIRDRWLAHQTMRQIADDLGRPLPWVVRALGELCYEANQLYHHYGRGSQHETTVSGE